MIDSDTSASFFTGSLVWQVKVRVEGKWQPLSVNILWPSDILHVALSSESMHLALSNDRRIQSNLSLKEKEERSKRDYIAIKGII
jgi:hypothetical protein